MGIQTRDAMQKEAIQHSAERLRENAAVTSISRGRIILPCGTGKSRIALHLIEELSDYDEVSVILCPSIALVARLRHEFLVQKNMNIDTLAVCSDETAGHSVSVKDDPTVDTGHARADEVKGKVTTDPKVIGEWIDSIGGLKKQNDLLGHYSNINISPQKIGVICGTYQSSFKIAEDLTGTHKKREIKVLVADEAHRTAGLRRVKKREEKLRDFTICHDQSRFPAKYRVY